MAKKYLLSVPYIIGWYWSSILEIDLDSIKRLWFNVSTYYLFYKYICASSSVNKNKQTNNIIKYCVKDKIKKIWIRF